MLPDEATTRAGRPVTAAASGAVRGRVLVLGSANVDSTVLLEDFPRPGETVFGTAGHRGLGGKGANQAVAAAHTGAHTTFLGTVGSDADGELVRRTLAAHGVDVHGLRVCADRATGQAHITVNARGENTIVVVSGANTALTAAEIDSPEVLAAVRAAGPAVAVSQGELPAATVDAFAALCRRHGIRFVLNLAPVIPVAGATLAAADPLVVNEHEAAALLGREPGGRPPTPEEARTVATELAGTFAASAVVTLGALGAVAADGGAAWHEPAPALAEVVDSTGAGDAFVGALAACLAFGMSLREAVRRGVAAGSAATGAPGTVASYHRLPRLCAS